MAGWGIWNFLGLQLAGGVGEDMNIMEIRWRTGIRREIHNWMACEGWGHA